VISFAPLRYVPPGSVVVGLISTKGPELETADSVKRWIDEACTFLSPDQLATSPQCGFASDEVGNLLSPGRLERKLERVGMGRAVWVSSREAIDRDWPFLIRQITLTQCCYARFRPTICRRIKKTIKAQAIATTQKIAPSRAVLISSARSIVPKGCEKSSALVLVSLYTI
jgi:hypothetical protein